MSQGINEYKLAAPDGKVIDVLRTTETDEGIVMGLFMDQWDEFHPNDEYGLPDKYVLV